MMNSNKNTFLIRTYTTEDIDYIVRRHKELYSEEYGFSSEFGGYVEKYVLKFNEHHDEFKENMWIAEENGKLVGMIALVKVDDENAQLRWFLIEPEVRGRGLGHLLIQTVIDFCKEQGYKHILLWTVNNLEAARHLYNAYNFKLSESIENKTWTNDVLHEERWDLDL